MALAEFGTLNAAGRVEAVCLVCNGRVEIWEDGHGTIRAGCYGTCKGLVDAQALLEKMKEAMEITPEPQHDEKPPPRQRPTQQRLIEQPRALEYDALAQNLPYSPQAEIAVLSAIFADSTRQPPIDAFKEVSLILTAEDFYVPAHEIIFEVMFEFAQKGLAQTFVAVGKALEITHRLERIGGWDKIKEIALAEPFPSAAAQHARIVRKDSIKRQAWKRSVATAEFALNGGDPVEVAARMDRAAKDIALLSDGGGDPYPDRHAVDAYEAHETAIAEGDGRSYSWEGLIMVGATAFITGLMGTGKSTLMMNLARGWALGADVLERRCVQSPVFVVVSSKEYLAWAETIHFWQLRELIFVVSSDKAQFGDQNKTRRWFESEMNRLGARTFVLDTINDFLGVPPNTRGDSNRLAMAEQEPLLSLVRERGYAGYISGHQPKSEAAAPVPRDPEESHAGFTGVAAQHRMRMALRRKGRGATALITGRGGFGDCGFLEEQYLVFNPETRLVSLAGLFSDHLGQIAFETVKLALTRLGTASRAQIEKETGQGRGFIMAALRYGMKKKDENGKETITPVGENRSRRYRLTGQQSDQGELDV